MNVKLMVTAACWLVCQSYVGANSNLTIESGVAQLFADDYLIERASNLHRTLCQSVKDDGGNQPVIELTDEFGDYTATLEANGTIVFDPRLKKYVMFALGLSAQKKGWDRVRLYRFTSGDGMAWTKGDDGKPQCIYPLDRDFFLTRNRGRTRPISMSFPVTTTHRIKLFLTKAGNGSPIGRTAAKGPT